MQELGTPDAHTLVARDQADEDDHRSPGKAAIVDIERGNPRQPVFLC